MKSMKPYYQDEYVTIYHADCWEALKLIPDNSVDLVLTDPPYDIRATTCGFDGGRDFIDRIHLEGMGSSFDFALLDVLDAKLRKPNHLYFCNKYQFKGYLEWIERRGYNFALLSWHKANVIPMLNHYLPDTEYLFDIWLDRKVRRVSDGRTYWITNLVHQRYGHPTAKPSRVVSEMILRTTDKGQVILDPFLGSGTTAYCAKKLGRKAIGIEILEKYAEIAARRCSQQAFDFVTDNGKKCYVCGGVIGSKRADARFCSNRCKQLAYRQRTLPNNDSTPVMPKKASVGNG